jgi:hypothetical protein
MRQLKYVQRLPAVSMSIYSNNVLLTTIFALLGCRMLVSVDYELSVQTPAESGSG